MATCSEAISPLAPGRFSTTKLWPVASESFCAITRAGDVGAAAGREADHDLDRTIRIFRRLGVARRRRETSAERNAECDTQ